MAVCRLPLVMASRHLCVSDAACGTPRPLCTERHNRCQQEGFPLVTCIVGDYRTHARSKGAVPLRQKVTGSGPQGGDGASDQASRLVPPRWQVQRMSHPLCHGREAEQLLENKAKMFASKAQK
jgi:hypothetical protein